MTIVTVQWMPYYKSRTTAELGARIVVWDTFFAIQVFFWHRVLDVRVFPKGRDWRRDP